MNKTILVRGWAAVCALVLLAGCTATRTGSAAPSNSPGSAAGSAGGIAASPAGESGVVLRSAVVLTGAPTSVSTRTVPTATSPQATVTTSSSTPTATSAVTVTRIAVVTSISTGTAISSRTADTADTGAPAPNYSCPTPAELDPSHHGTAVECYDGNHWLVTSGLYGDGEPADGIGIVHQTSPGVYQVVGGGSDLAGLDEELKSKGLPDDLVAHLAEGKALDHRTRYDHPLADFLTTWDRHTSELVLNGSGSGAMHLGSGCCNSISVPLTLKTDEYDGVLTAVSGAASYVGTEMTSVKVAVGTTVFFHFEQGASGPVLISTDPTHPGGAPIVWCGANYDHRCGA